LASNRLFVFVFTVGDVKMKTIEARRIAASAVAYTVSGGREKAIQSENH
jgi:hypothetical protein